MSDPRVIVVEAGGSAAWDRFVEAAGGSVFHRWAWLEAAAAESRTRLHCLAVVEGERWTGVLPLFEKRGGGLRVLFSPPPKCAIPGLGPLTADPADGYAMRERAHHAACRALAEHVEREMRPDMTALTTLPGVTDVRPLVWAGYGARPMYSYEIDLAREPEAIFEGFRKQVRTDIRRAGRYEDLRVIDGDRATFMDLVAGVRERYREQGLTWTVSDGYAAALYDAFGGRELFTSAAVAGGEIVAGLVLLRSGDRVQHWLGGTTPRGAYIGVNEMLHWHAIRQARERGARVYELVGGNTPHLCAHKSRYNPDLALYFDVERGNRKARAVRALLATSWGRRLARRL
jgi:CelD/BcsL family acetyltransferase involved in cellulose biosynthesis